jgi:hypothetical protein
MPVLRLVAGTLGLTLVSFGIADAQCTVPNALTNGTTADASQVMGNFNSVLSCINSAPGGSANAVQFNAGSGAFGGVGPLTNGQLLIGSTGAIPQAATLTAGAGITISNSAGAITIAAAGGGATTPTVRGSGIQASSASSYTVTWPTGSATGDLAIIYIGACYSLSSVPSGWTLLDSQIDSNWNGDIIAKVLSSTDISTGSISLGMTGTQDSVVAIVTFVGSTTSTVFQGSQRLNSGLTSVSFNGNGTQQGSTDYLVYFGSNRGASTNTVSLGTQLQQANDGALASGVLSGGALGTAGDPFPVSPTFSFSSAGAGYYVAAVSVRGP